MAKTKKAESTNVAEALKEKAEATAQENVQANPEGTPEEMVKAFNERFEKYATISQDGVTDDYKKECNEAFEAFNKEFNTSSFNIIDGNKEDALKAAKALKTYNEKLGSWENKGWVGALHFDEVITKVIEDLETGKTEKFDLDIFALIYIFESAKHPVGIGLESARVMKELDGDQKSEASFSKVLETLGKHIKYINALNKKGAILQQKAAMAESGFKLELKVTELEEYVAFYDALSSKE